MAINDQSAVKAQYSTAENLTKRMSIHEKYSVNPQGFGNWIVSQYRIEEGMSVLELGCGTGDMWAGQDALIARCARLILSDFSEGMLVKARETLRKQQKIEFQRIDIQDIPYPDDSFDVVIANMMLYHVPDIQKGLGEVRRVLKNTGTFYAATYGENGMMAYLSSLFSAYGIRNESNHQFTLQNGNAQLSRFFADVRRMDYIDALAVADTEDIADYIGSLTGMAALRNLPRDLIVSVLNEHKKDGILHIPKEYGLFIAK